MQSSLGFAPFAKNLRRRSLDTFVGIVAVVSRLCSVRIARCVGTLFMAVLIMFGDAGFVRRGT